MRSRRCFALQVFRAWFAKSEQLQKIVGDQPLLQPGMIRFKPLTIGLILTQSVLAKYEKCNPEVTICFEGLLLNRNLYLEGAYIKKNLSRMKAGMIFYRARL